MTNWKREVLERCSKDCQFCSQGEDGKLMCGVIPPNPLPDWCYLNKEPEYHPDADSENLGDEDVAEHINETDAKPAETEPKVPESETEQLKSDTNHPAVEPVELTANPAPRPAVIPPSKELKIVITLTGDSGMVGISKPGCDPVFYGKPDGGLPAVLGELDTNILDAEGKWSKSPRYPKAVTPVKPNPPPVTHVTPAVPKVNPNPVAKAPPPPPKSKIQNTMF